MDNKEAEKETSDRTIRSVSKFFRDLGFATGLQSIALGLALFSTPLVIGAKWPNTAWMVSMILLSAGFGYLFYLARELAELEYRHLWLVVQLAPPDFGKALNTAWSVLEKTGAFSETRLISALFPTGYTIVGLIVVFVTLGWVYRPWNYFTSYAWTIGLTVTLLLIGIFLYRFFLKNKVFLPALEQSKVRRVAVPIVSSSWARHPELYAQQVLVLTLDEVSRPAVSDFLEAQPNGRSGECVSQWGQLPSNRYCCILKLDFTQPRLHTMVLCFDLRTQGRLVTSINDSGALWLRTQSGKELFVEVPAKLQFQ